MEKREKLELTPRLRSLADWVEPGAKLADIGTDHGYLPVWLLLNGRIRSAIASDLRRGPLARAKETAAEFGVSEKLSFRLCDGLSGISAGETDTIVIAGLGGEKIAALLAAAPWTADGGHTLLLQPMTRAETLRGYLAAHGYLIFEERLVYDRDKLYPVLRVRAGKMDLSAGQLYGGAALLRDPLEDRYLMEEIIRFQAAVAGLNHSADRADLAKADRLRGIITALLEMREEWRHANRPEN
jgi:tRNA (adenine22-N1)-methyltransferase